MTQDAITQFLGTVVTALITAVLASWLTMRASLAQFHQEKWWERKHEAYTAIIESLYQLLNYFNGQVASYYRDKEESISITKARTDRYHEAEEDIDKATDIGSFVIADEAVETLKNLKKAREDLDKEVDNSTDLLDVYLAQADLVRECLDSIRDIAHRDLGVHPSKRSLWKPWMGKERPAVSTGITPASAR